MKSYLLLICLTLSMNVLCAKPAPARYEIEDPWYLSYKKAACTGAIIGLLMIPFSKISSTALSRLQNKFPDISSTLIVNPVSGMLAACFLVTTLKALDPYKSRDREKKKELLI